MEIKANQIDSNFLICPFFLRKLFTSMLNFENPIIPPFCFSWQEWNLGKLQRKVVKNWYKLEERKQGQQIESSFFKTQLIYFIKRYTLLQGEWSKWN